MRSRRYRLPTMADDPGSARTTVETTDGEHLDARWSGEAGAGVVAVLTHPHPRFGGDMDNVVPATLARVLPEHGLATLRFDFRGTRRSTGRHGDGVDEIEDVRAAVAAASARFPDAAVVAVGYSFGADVLLALDDDRLRAVVAVAPPLAVLPEDRLRGPRGGAPTLVLAAEHDQFRPFAQAEELTADWPDTSCRPVTGADHFLAGAVGRVADDVVAFLSQVARAG